MATTEPEEIQLQSGYYFSPGFYMGYWHSSIMSNFKPETVAFDGKLKQHREVWVGAHLAALKTKLSGDQFFVALPDSDPPDVLIGTFSKVKVPSGKTGHNLNWYPVEITRCDFASGETLSGQIANKNNSAYKDTVLAVYLQGAEKVPDFKALHKELLAMDKVWPHEIIVMVELREIKGKIPKGSFGFVQIYPNFDDATLKRDDKQAYFTDPNMMQVTGRGVQSVRVRVKTVRLMSPRIKEK